MAWIVIAACVEEVGSNDGDRAAVKSQRTRERSLVGMDDADDNRRQSRPPFTTGCLIERGAVIADPTQAGRACIILSDRIRRDQAERTVLAQQIECTAKKMSNQIRIAV